MHQISTVQRNLDSGFFISENTQYPAIGPVRACDVINIAGSFFVENRTLKIQGGSVPFFRQRLGSCWPGRFFRFLPLSTPLHTSPPRLFTGWEEDINAARFQRFSTGKEPVAKRDSSVFPSRWILFNTQSKRRNKMSIQFKNRDHERFYQQCLVRCGCVRSVPQGLFLHDEHQQRNPKAC